VRFGRSRGYQLVIFCFITLYNSRMKYVVSLITWRLIPSLIVKCLYLYPNPKVVAGSVSSSRLLIRCFGVEIYVSF
jgi:hypothetical protein